MPQLHGWICFGTFLLALSTPLLAHAETAQDAFNLGMKALGQAKYAEACQHFSRSEELGGRSIKTRYQLGRCNEEGGNQVEAHEAFLEAAQLAEKEGDTKRAEVARQRVVELEKRVPMLVLTVPPGARVEGLSIQVAGRTVEETRWGTPIAVQPGKYTVTISAPSLETVNLNVSAPDPGKRAELVIPTLVAAAPAGPPAVNGGGAVDGSPPPPPPSEDDDDDGPGRRSPGLFWTGVGLTAAGGLAVLAGASLAVIGAAETELGGDGEGGVAQGIGVLIAGGVFLGVGVPFMIVFGADAEEEPAAAWYVEPIVGPTGGGVRVRF